MYSSNSNSNDHNPISIPGQVFQHRPLYNSETNPNSKWDQENPPLSSIFHFPSPICMQYEDAVNELTWEQLHDLSLHQETFASNDQTALTNCNMGAADPNKLEAHDQLKELEDQKRKRRCSSSKKDRHSKINTAHGPRDRRMRLSLDVARKFFDLQDLLGFDKASRTVEWLLMQSSSAIKEITRGLQPRHPSCSIGANSTTISSTTSECEVLSGFDESTTNENVEKAAPASNISNTTVKIKASCNKEKRPRTRRTAAFHGLARESRKIARERARKRTIEKRIRLSTTASNLCSEAAQVCNDSIRLDTEESGTQKGPNMINESYEGGLIEMEELSSQDRPLFLGSRGYVGDDSLFAICNYQQNAEISHEHHFSEFQFCCKPWEAAGNIRSLVG